MLLIFLAWKKRFVGTYDNGFSRVSSTHLGSKRSVMGAPKQAIAGFDVF
jgi:hypothetical protein